MTEDIIMSKKETERITVMDRLVMKRVRQKHASLQLDLSVRQVQRLLARYRQEGIRGLVHRGRGRASNRALVKEQGEQIVRLIREYYADFGPTFAAEKLFERHGITISRETVRKLMHEEGIRIVRKRAHKAIHTYRERRSCIGEVVQLDGSSHRWFEERADPCTLLAFIDDATSKIMDGAFVQYEGTFTLFAAIEHYLLTHGKPLSLYVDRHSTFKINRQATIEEELQDLQPQSQFGRAIETLRIALIFANSPQAKGRVERLFETLQDRLVKELRLLGIQTKEEATQYFREVYIPKHNAKFAVLPKDPTDMHRPLLTTDNLVSILTIQSKRMVSKALVVQYKNTRYQLDGTGSYRYTLRNALIRIDENIEGILTFWYKDRMIPYKVLQQEVRQPRLVQVTSAKSFQEKRVNIPAFDHPWRRTFLAAA